MPSAKATIDRDEIRKWVESRGGFPAHVKRTGEDDDPGVLRIDYPGYSGTGSLERLSWDEFFEAFDRNNLAFLYQPTGQSRFSKLVDRNSVASKVLGRGESTRKTGGKKSAASKKRGAKKATTASKKSAAKKSSSKKSSSKKSSRKK